MSSDFINYTFGKLIEDIKKIIQAGVAGVVGEMVESKLKEIEDIRNRIIEIEKILEGIKKLEIIKEGNTIYNAGSLASPDIQVEVKKCKYEGCDKNAFSRGYCKNHYYQLKRKGLIKNIEIKREKKPCSVEGCTNVAISRGLCKNHYYQYKRGTLVFENGRFIKKNI